LSICPICLHAHTLFSRARCHYHCAGTSSSKPSRLEQVVYAGAFAVAGALVVGLGVVSAASTCVSLVARRSGSTAVPLSSPLKAADQLRVNASALSRDGSCSASMAGAAPAPALASAPVRAPVSWTWTPEPIYRSRTFLEVTAGVKATHVTVPKVNPATGGRFDTTRLRSYADAVNGREATLFVV
jgi:hypothetical protein